MTRIIPRTLTSVPISQTKLYTEEQKGDNDMSVNMVLCLNVKLRISTVSASAVQHYCFDRCSSMLQNQSKTTGLALWFLTLSSYYTDHFQFSHVLLYNK
jgi:hypothetical protein